MNQQNYQFLCDTLERHGLGHPAVYEALQTKMKLGQEEFEIKGLKVSFGDTKMEFTPKFGLGESNEGERYYLNKIKATFTNEKGESQTAEFSLYKQRGCNTKEMFNLMNGRPVYKKPKGEDGRWLKIDFSFTDDNGNLRPRSYYDETTKFNLSRELNKLPVKWANQEKEEAMQDLQNGEKYKTTIRKDGNTIEASIAVSPQLGGLTLYDKQNQVLYQSNTNSIEMVPEIDLGQGSKQLPESTKQIMNKINDPEKQAQGQKQRKAS